jgi:hypothetical protein
MAYRNGYRRGYRSQGFTPGRVQRVNKRAGACHYCAEEVPAGAGMLWRENDGSWSAVHTEQAWTGSPVSGFYAGGCPAGTDALNADAPWNRDGHVRSERDRIAGTAALWASRNPEPVRASTDYGRCSHEDYPCCGCGE